MADRQTDRQTDSQPASQPPSHPASHVPVAVRLYASSRAQKRSLYRLVWCRPCNDRENIEPTTAFHATTDSAKFHPDRSTFGRMSAEKPVLGATR